MATATLESVTQDGTNVYASAVVAEGGVLGNVSYNGMTTLLDAQGAQKSNAVLKAELTASIKATRDKCIAAVKAAIGAITGTITI